MKIQRSKTNDASALIATVILAVFIAGFLAVYLSMVSNEYRAVARSQTWNGSITVAESGAEEALALVNKTKSGTVTDWVLTAAADGWDTNSQTAYKNIHWASYSGTGSYTWRSTSGLIYHIRRYVDPTVGYYDVYINNSIPLTNEILCVGTSVNGSMNLTRSIYLKAIAVSESGNDGLIAYTLTFHGNNVTIDSFDSSTSAHSIWHTNLFFHGANYGTYSDSLSYDSNSPPSRTANVHVAAETNYIDVGNANIYGYINTSPGGTQSVGAQGSVGDLTWVHGGGRGLQAGHFHDDMNQTFTSAKAPDLFTNSVQTNNFLSVATGSATTTNVILVGCSYSNGVAYGGVLYTNKLNAGWVLPNGDGTTSTYANVITNRPQATNNIYYAMDSLNNNLYVDSSYAVLYLTNGMNGPNLHINTNSDLTIYSRGDITFGSTANSTALARALTINDTLGHPINITASGNASGVAKIFAPGSSVTLNGGGSETIDIIGEICCKSADFNGHFNLHFDESLRTSSPAQQFTVVSWKEVQVQ
jgi:hypothetical protein